MAYDILRIIAAFSVVVLHAAAHPWYYLEINSWDWFITNAYDAAFRFGVPIFVMISGALFLQVDKELPLKRLYLHNILRLLIVYGVWTLIYVGKPYLSSLFATQEISIDWKVFIKSLLTGPYHLWYLPMLAGIYMICPVLKRWLSHAPRREQEYFLLLFVVFQISKTTLSCFIKTPEVHQFLDILQPEAVCSYVGYFVLGYYLSFHQFSPKFDRFLFAMLPVSFGANIVVSTLLSRRSGTPEGVFFDSFGVFTLLISMALFRICIGWQSSHKEAQTSQSTARRLLHGIAQDTLGIYLIHLLIMDSPSFLKLYGILPVAVSVPLISIVVFLLSLVIAAVLRRIPLVGRYLC